jgi:hypothetical protein
MGEPLRGIRLVDCGGTTIRYGEESYDVEFRDHEVHIARDADNCAVMTLDSLEVPYESRIGEEASQTVRTRGHVDYSRHFSVAWDDDLSLPEIRFLEPPTEVVRRYYRGQTIELGLNPVNEYRVEYVDGVEATFTRRPKGFDFRFNTGFYGSFWREPDDSCVLKFKGDRLDPAEDAQRSQSKFIVSRSKYTGNLLLVLQDDATVHLQ